MVLVHFVFVVSVFLLIFQCNSESFRLQFNCIFHLNFCMNNNELSNILSNFECSLHKIGYSWYCDDYRNAFYAFYAFHQSNWTSSESIIWELSQLVSWFFFLLYLSFQSLWRIRNHILLRRRRGGKLKSLI